MSKANEKAFEKYPVSIDETWKDRNKRPRTAYIEGYQQAEKDNELTWEDVSKIISIDQQVCGTMEISNYTHNHQQAMEEILKRFKEIRNERPI